MDEQIGCIVSEKLISVLILYCEKISQKGGGCASI